MIPHVVIPYTLTRAATPIAFVLTAYGLFFAAPSHSHDRGSRVRPSAEQKRLMRARGAS